MNPTLFNTQRALAAAIALTLAVVAWFLATALADDLGAGLNDRGASEAAVTSTQLPPATWAHDPLASPINALQDSR